jgi:hypothetical protein
MSNHLYAIHAHYFDAGIMVNRASPCDDGVIVTATPILRYTVGWNFRDFAGYCEKKKWGVVDASIHRTGS